MSSSSSSSPTKTATVSKTKQSKTKSTSTSSSSSSDSSSSAKKVNNNNNKSTLMFFYKSAEKEAGKGASEILAEGDDFSELNKISNWRQKLSNFYPCNIHIDGLTFPSVEHFFQASKFKDVDNEYYKSFSINSNSKLSKSDGATAKSAGRKIKLSTIQLTKWNKSKRQVMINAWNVKFLIPEFKSLLLATGNSILSHRPPRSKLVIEYDLMKIRDDMKSSSSST